MRKIGLFVGMLSLLPSLVFAASKPTYLEEMYALGTISGQGLACKSKKYHQFELLARALIVSKAANAQAQRDGMERYASGKVDAFMAMEDEKFISCPEVLQAFDNQPIFKSTLYSDGRIKMYDGTVIKPRKAYDASKLYEKDREAFIKMDRSYKKHLAEAQKNAQNAKKIPLHDAKYAQFANEFGN